MGRSQLDSEADGEMKTRRIEQLSGGRFISHHLGAEVYHDSRHQVIKVKCEGGVIVELVLEGRGDAWLYQMISVNPLREISIIEY